METRLMVAEAKVATNPELLAAAGGKRKADDQGENPVVVPQPVAKDSPDGPPLEASEAPTFQEGGSSSSGVPAPDQNMNVDDAAQVGQRFLDGIAQRRDRIRRARMGAAQRFAHDFVDDAQ